MRRPLTLAALGLLLFGLELATGAVSLTAVRLGTGLSALLAGEEFLVSGPRYVIGVALAATGLYGSLLWAERAQRKIMVGGSTCPECGTQTRRVRRRRRHRILSRIIETSVTRRQCERCGWNGLAA